MPSRTSRPTDRRHTAHSTRTSRAVLAGAAGLALAAVGTSAAAAAAAPAPQTVGTACTAGQLLGNPGFETGSAAPWTTTPGIVNKIGAGEVSHSGTWYAWLNGYGTVHTDTLQQTVAVPTGCTAETLSFWLHIDTSESTVTTAFDKLTVQILTPAGATTLATFSNLNHATGYIQHSYNLAAFAGRTVTLKFTGTEDASLQTSFVIDDTAVNVS